MHPAASHGGQLATTVDVAQDVTVLQLHLGVAVDAAGMHGRRNKAGGGGDARCVVDVRGDVLAAVAAAVDGAQVAGVGGAGSHTVADGHPLAVDGHLGVLQHIAQLAAAIDITIDGGVAADVDFGVLALGHTGPDAQEAVGVGLIGGAELEQTSHARAEDVAAGGVHDVGDIVIIPCAAMCAGETVHLVLVGHHVALAVTRCGIEDGVGELSEVADGSAGDVNLDIAVVVAVLQLAIIVVTNGYEVGTHRGQTAAAVDGAEHGGSHRSARHGVVVDIDFDVAADGAGRVGRAAESAAAAEDIAVDIRGAPGAYPGSAVDGHLGVAQHVTILAAAEDGTEDEAAADLHGDILHVGAHVELGTLVTLAGTEEVAGDGVVGDGVDGSR